MDCAPMDSLIPPTSSSDLRFRGIIQHCAARMSEGAVLVFRLLIYIYRHTFSYFLGRQCRFQPTCSVYADEALRLHGPLKGAGLALRRLCRCHPNGGSGFDPVPLPDVTVRS